MCVPVCFRGEIAEGWGRSAAASCGNHSNLLLPRPGGPNQLGHGKYRFCHIQWSWTTILQFMFCLDYVGGEYVPTYLHKYKGCWNQAVKEEVMAYDNSTVKAGSFSTQHWTSHMAKEQLELKSFTRPHPLKAHISTWMCVTVCGCVTVSLNETLSNQFIALYSLRPYIITNTIKSSQTNMFFVAKFSCCGFWSLHRVQIRAFHNAGSLHDRPSNTFAKQCTVCSR